MQEINALSYSKNAVAFGKSGEGKTTLLGFEQTLKNGKEVTSDMALEAIKSAKTLTNSGVRPVLDALVQNRNSLLRDNVQLRAELKAQKDENARQAEKIATAQEEFQTAQNSVITRLNDERDTLITKLNAAREEAESAKALAERYSVFAKAANAIPSDNPPDKINYQIAKSAMKDAAEYHENGARDDIQTLLFAEAGDAPLEAAGRLNEQIDRLQIISEAKDLRIFESDDDKEEYKGLTRKINNNYDQSIYPNGYARNLIYDYYKTCDEEKFKTDKTSLHAQKQIEERYAALNVSGGINMDDVFEGAGEFRKNVARRAVQYKEGEKQEGRDVSIEYHPTLGDPVKSYAQIGDKKYSYMHLDNLNMYDEEGKLYRG